MKHDLVTLVVIMILKDTVTFKVLVIVSLFCAWNITTVEINSSVHLLKSYIRQVPLFTSGGLGLGLVSTKQRSWSWSCYFCLGLSLGLKNLVLFTSLLGTVYSDSCSWSRIIVNGYSAEINRSASNDMIVN